MNQDQKTSPPSPLPLIVERLQKMQRRTQRMILHRSMTSDPGSGNHPDSDAQLITRKFSRHVLQNHKTDGTLRIGRIMRQFAGELRNSVAGIKPIGISKDLTKKAPTWAKSMEMVLPRPAAAAPALGAGTAETIKGPSMFSAGMRIEPLQKNLPEALTVFSGKTSSSTMRAAAPKPVRRAPKPGERLFSRVEEVVHREASLQTPPDLPGSSAPRLEPEKPSPLPSARPVTPPPAQPASLAVIRRESLDSPDDIPSGPPPGTSRENIMTPPPRRPRPTLPNSNLESPPPPTPASHPPALAPDQPAGEIRRTPISTNEPARPEPHQPSAAIPSPILPPAAINLPQPVEPAIIPTQPASGIIQRAPLPQTTLPAEPDISMPPDLKKTALPSSRPGVEIMPHVRPISPDLSVPAAPQSLEVAAGLSARTAAPIQRIMTTRQPLPVRPRLQRKTVMHPRPAAPRPKSPLRPAASIPNHPSQISIRRARPAQIRRPVLQKALLTPPALPVRQVSRHRLSAPVQPSPVKLPEPARVTSPVQIATQLPVQALPRTDVPEPAGVHPDLPSGTSLKNIPPSQSIPRAIPVRETPAPASTPLAAIQRKSLPSISTPPELPAGPVSTVQSPPQKLAPESTPVAHADSLPVLPLARTARSPAHSETYPLPPAPQAPSGPPSENVLSAILPQKPIIQIATPHIARSVTPVRQPPPAQQETAPVHPSPHTPVSSAIPEAVPIPQTKHSPPPTSEPVSRPLPTGSPIPLPVSRPDLSDRPAIQARPATPLPAEDHPLPTKSTPEQPAIPIRPLRAQAVTLPAIQRTALEDVPPSTPEKNIGLPTAASQPPAPLPSASPTSPPSLSSTRVNRPPEKKPSAPSPAAMPQVTVPSQKIEGSLIQRARVTPLAPSTETPTFFQRIARAEPPVDVPKAAPAAQSVSIPQKPLRSEAGIARPFSEPTALSPEKPGLHGNLPAISAQTSEDHLPAVQLHADYLPILPLRPSAPPSESQTGGPPAPVSPQTVIKTPDSAHPAIARHSIQVVRRTSHLPSLPKPGIRTSIRGTVHIHRPAMTSKPTPVVQHSSLASPARAIPTVPAAPIAQARPLPLPPFQPTDAIQAQPSPLPPSAKAIPVSEETHPVAIPIPHQDISRPLQTTQPGNQGIHQDILPVIRAKPETIQRTANVLPPAVSQKLAPARPASASGLPAWPLAPQSNLPPPSLALPASQEGQKKTSEPISARPTQPHMVPPPPPSSAVSPSQAQLVLPSIPQPTTPASSPPPLPAPSAPATVPETPHPTSQSVRPGGPEKMPQAILAESVSQSVEPAVKPSLSSVSSKPPMAILSRIQRKVISNPPVIATTSHPHLSSTSSASLPQPARVFSPAFLPAQDQNPPAPLLSKILETSPVSAQPKPSDHFLPALRPAHHQPAVLRRSAVRSRKSQQPAAQAKAAESSALSSRSPSHIQPPADQANPQAVASTLPVFHLPSGASRLESPQMILRHPVVKTPPPTGSASSKSPINDESSSYSDTAPEMVLHLPQPTPMPASNTLQRVLTSESESRRETSGPSDSPTDITAEMQSKDKKSHPQPNLNDLAQKVYPLVKRLLAIEMERHPRR